MFDFDSQDAPFDPPDPNGEAEQKERWAIALGQDLAGLTQVQPNWGVFAAWMRRRANDIARASLRDKESGHSRDYWEGRLDECEGLLADLQRTIDVGLEHEAVNLELATKIRGEDSAA